MLSLMHMLKLTHLEVSVMVQLSKEEISGAQDRDPTISVTKRAMNSGIWPTITKDSSPDTVLLQQESKKLVVKAGMLYRKATRVAGGQTLQLVLPNEHRLKVLKSLHDDLSHLGVERTTELVKDRFYWPKMVADIG